ncbi:MAG: c-type cytochrome [Rhodanobacter sp.]
MKFKTKSISSPLYLAFALATGLVAWAPSTASAAQPADAAQQAAQFGRGASEWRHSCGSCHNLRSPSELTNAEWEVAMGQMRVRANLTGAQERDILAFLKASTPKQAAAPAPVSQAKSQAPAESTEDSTKQLLAAGSTIYHQTCIACHRADGKGDIPGISNLADPKGPLSQTDATLEDSIRNGINDAEMPIAMPPKGGNATLNDADIRNVLLYLRDTFGAKK